MIASPQPPFTLISASTPAGCARTDVRAVFEAFGPLVGPGVRFPVGAKENNMWVDFARHEDAKAALLGLHGKIQKEWVRFRWTLVWDRSTRLKLLNSGILQPTDASMKSIQIVMPQRMPPGPVKRPNTVASAAGSATAASSSEKHVSPVHPTKKLVTGPLPATGLRAGQGIPKPSRPSSSGYTLGAKGRGKVSSSVARPIVATPETQEQRAAMSAAVASINRSTATIKGPLTVKPRVATPGFSLDDLLPTPSPRTPPKVSARSTSQTLSSPAAGHLNTKPTPPEKLTASGSNQSAAVATTYRATGSSKSRPQPIHESGPKRTSDHSTVVSSVQHPVIECSAALKVPAEVCTPDRVGSVSGSARRGKELSPPGGGKAVADSDTSSSESSSGGSDSSCSDSEESNGGSQFGDRIQSNKKTEKVVGSETVKKFDATEVIEEQKEDDDTNNLVAGSFAKFDVLVGKLSQREASAVPLKRKFPLKVSTEDISDSETQPRKTTDLTQQGWYGVQHTSVADNSLIATFPF